LNRDYAPHGISFKLVDEPDYTENAEWAEGKPFSKAKVGTHANHPEIKVCTNDTEEVNDRVVLTRNQMIDEDCAT